MSLVAVVGVGGVGRSSSGLRLALLSAILRSLNIAALLLAALLPSGLSCCLFSLGLVSVSLLHAVPSGRAGGKVCLRLAQEGGGFQSQVQLPVDVVLVACVAVHVAFRPVLLVLLRLVLSPLVVLARPVSGAGGERSLLLLVRGQREVLSGSVVAVGGSRAVAPGVLQEPDLAGHVAPFGTQDHLHLGQSCLGDSGRSQRARGPWGAWSERGVRCSRCWFVRQRLLRAGRVGGGL